MIRDLAGHGVGTGMHEEPENILNYRVKNYQRRFAKNTTVAIETCISTRSNNTRTLKDGWTLVGDRGGFVAQHEHTILVTDAIPVILTQENEIWK